MGFGLRAAGLGVVLAAMACSSPPPPACTGAVPAVLVVMSDFSSSAVGALPLDGSPASLLFGSQLGADPVLASSQGRRFFIARDLDSFFEADLCGNAVRNLSARTAGEVNVDPQDVAVAPNGALWVARLTPDPKNPAPSILVTGSGTATTIDMSAFDADGNPDASSVRIVGTNAFVALERLTNDKSTQPSQMAVLDTTTLGLLKTVTLAGRNPFGQMHEANGKLWLADAGDFTNASEPDAGIEVFDTVAMTTALAFTEPTLGGSVVEVAVDPTGTCGVAILADATTANHTSLVSFTVGAANAATVVAPTTGFDLRGLLWITGGKLLVADARPTSQGFPVRVFSSSSCTLSEEAPLLVPTLPPLAFSN